MTFDDLKDAVPWETVLIDALGEEGYFISLNPLKNRLITVDKRGNFDAYSWRESNIRNWRIKKPNIKLYAYKLGCNEVVYYRKETACPSDRAPEYDLEFE